MHTNDQVSADTVNRRRRIGGYVEEVESRAENTEDELTGEFAPVPVSIAVQPPAKKRRSRRKWYRRKLTMALASLAAILLIGSVAGMMYVNRQFGEFNNVSTPPPMVSAKVIDPEATGEIDTKPASRALEIADSGATGEFTLGGDVVEGASVSTTPGTSLNNGEPSTLDAQSTTDGASASPDIFSPDAGPGGDKVVSDLPDTSDQPASIVLKPVEASDDGSINILLMGVDARLGEEIDIGVRPDSLSVLHLDPKTGSCRILAVPRDTRTELPGYGQTKINHALAVGGIDYQVLVVEQLLEIEIDHYGLIDFAGIQELVDAVGGVTVFNDTAFMAQGVPFEAGELTLNGEEALIYARFRYDKQGDFGRIERQQQIIRAIINQTSGMDVLQGANKLLGALDGHFKTDLSPASLIRLASDYRTSCTSSSLEVANLEGTVETLPDPLLNLNLSYVIVDQEEIDRKVKWLLEGE